MVDTGTDWTSAAYGIALGVGIGWLIGRWWAMSMMTHYLKSKIPDRHGFRTGFWLAGSVHYIVTGKEYGELLVIHAKRSAATPEAPERFGANLHGKPERD
jgi:hypothetical protein